MDSPGTDIPKLPDMVMCGDHPSFTKTELNAKETNPDEKEWEKVRDNAPLTYGRITPSTSRERTTSDHCLSAAARKRVRSLEAVPRTDPDVAAQANRALVQAALGSFGWPPYLVCVWVLLLGLTHALHCLVAVLERALPVLERLCKYFRKWTEDTWREERDASRRLYPVGLGAITGALYAAYAALYAAYCAATWATEPLGLDPQATRVTVTDYVDIVASATDTDTKR